LRRAAFEIAERENPNALSVFGFASDDEYSHGTYTAGEAIWAPNGKWEDADEDDPPRVTVTLGKLYFQDPVDVIPEGSSIELFSDSGDKIHLSRTFDGWEDSEIIQSYPSGMKAIIVESRTEALTPDHALIRYLVEIKNVRGWVHSYEIR